MYVYFFLFFQVASATTTRCGLSRGLLGLKQEQIKLFPFGHNKIFFVHTRDAVDYNEGSVSDTQGGGDLRREVNVAGGVDEVDKE